jgi:Holin of 3TMs, for gene-transfer release
MAIDPVTAALNLGGTLIERLFPNPADRDAAKLKLLELQQAGDLARLSADTSITVAQIDVNKEQAKSSNFFVSGPRPFLMWVGGLGVAAQWLVIPLASFAYTTYTGSPLPVQPPEIDGNILALVASLMGIQIGARTVEKVKGVATQ